MALNLKQKLFLSAAAAAGHVDLSLNHADRKAARESAFQEAGFDHLDYEYWSYCFDEAHGRLAQLSPFKTASERKAESDAKEDKKAAALAAQ